MSDKKLVKTALDAATLTGLAAGIGWAAKKGCEREFHIGPQQQRNELRPVHLCHGARIAPKQYLTDQKILPDNV